MFYHPTLSIWEVEDDEKYQLGVLTLTEVSAAEMKTFEIIW